MIAKPPHNRKLVLSGIALTKMRYKDNDLQALSETRDILETIIINSDYLNDAPFSWVGISIRYGLKYEEKPHYQGISKKYGDLSLAIEVDSNEMIEASYEELVRIFTAATLKALIHAGHKYKRPVEALEKMLDRMLGKK